MVNDWFVDEVRRAKDLVDRRSGVRTGAVGSGSYPAVYDSNRTTDPRARPFWLTLSA